MTTTPNDIHDITSLPEKPRKKKRIFLWTFLAIQALFIVWIVSAVSADPTADCSGDCEDVATGIAVFFQIGLWFAVNLFLGLGYAIYRLAKRP